MIHKRVKVKLEDQKIVLFGEGAGEIYSRFNIGEMVDDEVHLSPVEGLYLLDTGKIEIEGVDSISDLLRVFYEEWIKYLAYRDLKQRGVIVRPFCSPYDFSIYRGRGSHESAPATSWVKVVSEDEPVSLTDIGRWVHQAQQARKRMIVSVVDEEGDVTYYEIRLLEMHGASPIVQRMDPEDRYECFIINRRGTIFDKEAAARLHTTFFFGRMLGDTLHLSLLEAIYLEEMGAVKLLSPDRKPLLGREIIQTMEKCDPENTLRIRTYFALRGSGLIPKTGFKYGVYFRAYLHSPEEEHAPYLIHTVDEETKYTWAEVSRAVRLAHGVRKEMVFCKIDEKEGPVFYQVSRIKV
jgi:tRNA-intron endonuclease